MHRTSKNQNTENMARQFFGVAFVVFLLATALLGMKAWAGDAQGTQQSVIKRESNKNIVARSLKVRRSMSNRQLRRLQRMGSLTRALASHIR